MKQEIDFLKGTRSEREKKARFLRLIKTASILILLVYCLILAAFFSYSFYLNSSSKKVALEITSKRSKIEYLKEIETLQLILKQRLSSLLKFFDSKKTYNLTTLLDFFDQIAKDTSIRELSFSPNGNIKFSGEAIDIIAMGRLLENLTDEQASKNFSSVILSNLDKNENEASYLFTILLESRI